MSTNIEAPVVEKPEIDSKTASITDGIDDEIKYGREPDNPITIQFIETIAEVTKEPRLLSAEC